MLVGYFVAIFFESSSEVGLESESFIIQTEDGVDISGTIYYPKDFDPNTKYPALLYSHGLTGNRYSDPVLRHNLINRGFVVVCSDSRGHGFSFGGLGVDPSRTPSQNHSLNMILDVDAALNYVLTKSYVDEDKIGIYGTSLGGGVMAYYSWFDSLRDTPLVKAVVVVSFVGQIMIDVGINETNPGNYLAIVGEKDEFYSAVEFEGTLKALTGNDNAKYNTLYGEFDEGTAREVFVIPGVGHLDSGALTTVNNETVKWFETIFFGTVSDTPLTSSPPIEAVFDSYKEFVHYFLKILIVYFIALAIFSNTDKKEDIEVSEDTKWKIKQNTPLYLFGLAAIAGGFSAIGLQYVMAIPKMGAPALFSILICTLIFTIIIFKLKNKDFKFSSIISDAKCDLKGNSKQIILLVVLSSFCLMSIDIFYYLWIGNFIRTINEVIPAFIMGAVLFFAYYFNQLFLFKKPKKARQSNEDINYGASFLNLAGGHLAVIFAFFLIMGLGFVNVLNTFILIPFLVFNVVAIAISIIIHGKTKSIFLSSLIPAIYMGWYLSVAFPTIVIF